MKKIISIIVLSFASLAAAEENVAPTNVHQRKYDKNYQAAMTQEQNLSQPTDPSCNYSMFKRLKLSQECIVANDNSACLELGVSDHLSGKSTVASTMFGAVLEQLPSDVTKKMHQVLEALKEEVQFEERYQQLERQARAKWDGQFDEEIKKATNGRYSSLEELKRGVYKYYKPWAEAQRKQGRMVFGDMMRSLSIGADRADFVKKVGFSLDRISQMETTLYGGNGYSHADNMRIAYQIDGKKKAILSTLIEGEKDATALKQRMALDRFGVRGTSYDIQRARTQRLALKIDEIFKSDSPELKQAAEMRQKAAGIYERIRSSSKYHVEWQSGSEEFFKRTPAGEALAQEAVALERQAQVIETQVAKANPRVELGQALSKSAYSLQRDLVSEPTKAALSRLQGEEQQRVALERAERVQAIEAASARAAATAPSGSGRMAAATEKLKSAGRFARSAGINAGLVLGPIALFQGGSIVVDRMTLNGCAKDYDLTPRELDYLKDGSFFSVKAKANLGGCENVRLVTDPVEEYDKMLATFGGVPSGICKIAMNQAKNMDALIPSPDKTKISCNSDSISGNGYMVVPYNGESKLQVQGKFQTLELNWNRKDGYPDQFKPTITKGGIRSSADESEFQKFMNERLLKYGTKGEQIEFPPEADILAPCDEPKFCDHRSKILTARLAMSMKQAVCPGPERAAPAAGAVSAPDGATH